MTPWNTKQCYAASVYASRVGATTLSSVTTTYGYDDIDQLTSESRTGYSGSYTYDANGNRLTRTVGGVTENYSYDDADKLQDVKVGGVTQKSYGYDSAGRTTSVVSGAGTTTLAYDYEGRITTITYPSTATNTFTYNGLDTRVGKVDSGGTATYKRDGAGVTAPVLNDGAATYTPGISERRSSTTTFLHSGLKNADSQTGTGQTIGASRQYDAFGNVLSSTGTWKGPFGYAGSFGYQEDADSSLKLLGHRYYDASIGRFLTRDPIKDGRNWYVYGGNGPTSVVDPDGSQYVQLVPLIWPPYVVPPAPPGVNVRRNAVEARDKWRLHRDYPPAWPSTDAWFLNKVRPGGDWDYKQGCSKWENFGNFNYGVVSAAYGIPLDTALWSGGVVQKGVGTSRDDWGSPWTGPPYGDDPQDQYWIKQGYLYYMHVIVKK